jgi:hypothetical protein
MLNNRIASIDLLFNKRRPRNMHGRPKSNGDGFDSASPWIRRVWLRRSGVGAAPAVRCGRGSGRGGRGSGRGGHGSGNGGRARLRQGLARLRQRRARLRQRRARLRQGRARRRCEQGRGGRGFGRGGQGGVASRQGRASTALRERRAALRERREESGLASRQGEGEGRTGVFAFFRITSSPCAVIWLTANIFFTYFFYFFFLKILCRMFHF